MKRFLILGICCLCLCGCGKKEFQASEFEWKDVGVASHLYYATGSIKNNTSKDCKSLYIDLIYRSGDLTEKGLCLNYDGIKSEKTINVECMYTGDINNITDYKIEVENITCGG